MDEETKFPKDEYITIIRERMEEHCTINNDGVIVDYGPVFAVISNMMLNAWNSCHTGSDKLKAYEIVIGRPITEQEQKTLPPLKVLRSLENRNG